jgi:hypothetical protein
MHQLASLWKILLFLLPAVPATLRPKAVSSTPRVVSIQSVEAAFPRNGASGNALHGRLCSQRLCRTGVHGDIVRVG